MRPAAVFVCCVALLAACGARTSLEDGDAGISSLDAGARDAAIPADSAIPPPDASRPDASRPDAGVIDCVLGVVVDPFDVFTAPEPIEFVGADVAARTDGFDLVASTEGPPDGTGEIRLRRLRLPLGMVALSGTTTRAGSAGPAFAAPHGEGLAVAATRVDRTPVVDVWRSAFVLDRSIRIDGDGPEVLDVAAREGLVLTAVRRARTGVRVIEASGALGPRLEIDTTPFDVPLTLIATARGFAWVTAAGETGEVEVATWIDARIGRSRHAGYLRGAAAPGLAAWPFAEDALAIVGHAPGGIEVRVASEDGAELARREGLAFSMFGETTPAVVGTARGLVVASMEFGDANPQGGAITIHVLDRDLATRAELSVPIARTARLAPGRLGIASSGEHVVVHWTDYDMLPEVGVPRTRALVLGCP